MMKLKPPFFNALEFSQSAVVLWVAIASWATLMSPSLRAEQVLFSTVPDFRTTSPNDPSWNELRSNSTALWSFDTRRWREWAPNYTGRISVHPDGWQVFHAASKEGVVLDNVLRTDPKLLKLDSIRHPSPVPIWSPKGDRMVIPSEDGLHIIDLDGLGLALLQAEAKPSDFFVRVVEVDDVARLPSFGRNLMALAKVGGAEHYQLHLRIFDQDSKVAVDLDESEITGQSQLATLRDVADRVTNFALPSPQDAEAVIAAALSLPISRIIFPDFSFLDYLQDFSWSPDGNHLAVTGRITPAAPEASQVPARLETIFIVHVANGHVEQLIRPEWNYYGGKPWINARFLVICPDDDEDSGMLVEGDNEEEVRSGFEGCEVIDKTELVTPMISEWTHVSGPLWSPQGDLIAATVQRHRSILFPDPDDPVTKTFKAHGLGNPAMMLERNVVVVDSEARELSSAALRRLTDDENPYPYIPSENRYLNEATSWSPDGSQIAFTKTFAGLDTSDGFQHAGTYVMSANSLPAAGSFEGRRIKDRGGASQWVELDPLPVSLTIDLSSPLNDVGDTTTAFVKARLIRSEPHTVAFHGPLLQEIVDAEDPQSRSLLTLSGAEPTPNPFVLDAANPEAVFPVAITVTRRGISTLHSEIDVTTPEGTVERITEDLDILINPLEVSLRALPLVDGEPIVNMTRDPDTGKITDEHDIPIEPRIEVTLTNSGDRPVQAFLQQISPRARDLTPLPGRVRVDDTGQRFPYQLPEPLAPGQHRTIVYPLEIVDDGRFAFIAFASAAYLNDNGDPLAQTLTTSIEGAPIAVGEPYPLEIEIEPGGGNLIGTIRNGTVTIAPGSNLNLLATIRNLKSNSTIEFRGIDATGKKNALGGAFTNEPACPPTATFHKLDANSSITLPAQIQTFLEGPVFGTVQWKYPEDGKIVDDATGDAVKLRPDDVLIKSDLTEDDAPLLLKVVQNYQLPPRNPDITVLEGAGQFSEHFLNAFGQWAYSSFDSIGSIGRFFGRHSVTGIAAAFEELGDSAMAVLAIAEQINTTWSEMAEAKRTAFLQSILPDVQGRAQLIYFYNRESAPFDIFDAAAAFEFTQKAVYPFFSGIEEAYANQDYRKVWALMGTASGHLAIEVAMCALPTKFATHRKGADLAKLAENADNVRAATEQQRLLRTLKGPVDRDQAAAAWGAGGEELTRTEAVLRALGMRGYARERSTRATNLIENLKIAINKPEHMKPKGINELDIHLLGGPKDAPGIKGHDGIEYTADGITAIFEPPSEKFLRDTLPKRDPPLDPEVIERVILKAEERRKEWAKHEAKFREWSDKGFDVTFNYKDNGVRPTLRELLTGNTKKRRFKFDEIPLEDGRKMYVPRLTNDADEFRLITGDVDWVHFCWADGRPLDPATARRLYDTLQSCCGLQHGETIAWIRDGLNVFDSKAEQLKDYLLGNKALLEVGGESLRATTIMPELTRIAGNGRSHIVYFDNGTKELLKAVAKADSLNRTFNALDRVFSARHVIIPAMWLNDVVEGAGRQDFQFNRSSTSDLVTQNDEGNLQSWDGERWIAYTAPPGPLQLTPVTVTDAPASAGETRLSTVPMEDLFPGLAVDHLFQPGDEVVVAPGETEQSIHTVTALGSLILDPPLPHDYPVGTIVALVPGSGDGGGDGLDTDGDGFTDAQERNLGTDPNNPSSHFRIITASYSAPGIIGLSWPSLPGRTYTIEASPTLTQNSWTPLTTIESTASITKANFLQVPAVAGKTHYYRVRFDE